MIERVRMSSRQGSQAQRALTILDAMRDPALFKPFFKNPRSWKAWLVVLAAIFALPMTTEQLAIYQQLTGRTEAQNKIAKEVWLCIGRRGGKSRILALIATWLAAFHDYKPYLAPGEKGVVQIIACDRRQAKVALRYVKAFISQTPMLARMVESETADSISLTNDIVIEVVTNSYRSCRGFTLVAALCDEISFWQGEGCANPDTEILAALRPAMATIPNAMLLCASSPYAKRGALYEAHKAHFGKDHDSVLVVQADTATINPIVDAKIIADAYEADPASAAAEFGAQFRNDIESFVSIEAVNACVSRGIYERPYDPAKSYLAFVDPSGGSADSFCLAVGHHDYARQTVVIDCLREVQPPFSPESVTEKFCRTLKEYRVSVVTGDRYGGEWPREQFSKLGIRYEPSALPKSELYRDLLPLINSARVELLDHAKLVNQLCGLERRTSRGGRDSIDHSPGAHDDVANVVAGLSSLANQHNGYDCSYRWVDGDSDDSASDAREQRRQRILAIMNDEIDGDSTGPAHPTLSDEELRRIASPIRLGTW
ncbi:hypothetical protein V4R08_05090 [Nitrobacter sp. NHB1]|uniref:hypothetical protein n=1 Tax=Nitrobacter sp. NHB1 TaxID=3119830 RepID=UPI002FFFD196